MMFKLMTDGPDIPIMHQKMISQGPLVIISIHQYLTSSSSFKVAPFSNASIFISVLHHSASYSHDHDHCRNGGAERVRSGTETSSSVTLTCLSSNPTG